MSNTPTDTQTTTETQPDRDRNPNRTVDTVDTGTMKLLSGLVALIGIWIAASPFVFESTETALWNNVLVGAAIFLLAGYNYYRMSNAHLASVGVASLVALLGLWALASPFVLGMGSETLLWSTAISGLVVAALSGYNAYANQNADTRARTGTETRA